MDLPHGFSFKSTLRQMGFSYALDEYPLFALMNIHYVPDEYPLCALMNVHYVLDEYPLCA